MPTKATTRQAKYDATHCRTYGLKLNTKTDADIIHRLTEVKSMQGYIKELIRADIAKSAPVSAPKNEKEEKKMRIASGHSSDGRDIEIVLDSGRLWIVDIDTGDMEQFNDEWYAEDDTASINSAIASMISDGYHFN